MEEWELVLEAYPSAPELKAFIKMLKTAEVLLKQDLAVFESEWITSTLFFKPVNLLETVSSKYNDTAWGKPISDAFKLITDIVDKYTPDHLYENIVTLCLLPYTAHIRRDALACLTSVTRLSAEGAREAPRMFSELEDMTTCKAQLAVLVGVICEYHPEVAADSAPRIWRVYLNLLDSNKNTDTVTKSVLQGLLGLFKHFGAELPLMEFRDLYEKISREYLMKGKCEEACLSILEHHSGLFKELLSKDAKLRGQLWKLHASSALKAVYSTVATAVSNDQLQNIADTELHPRVESRNTQSQYTALRILRHLGLAYKDDTDAVSLDHELRRGKVSYEVADKILWCIESNSLQSEKLLKTAVLFHDNIPAKKRRETVVYGLLNAPEDVRTTTTALLINESSQSEGANIDKYLPLWKDIFDSKNGTDSIILDKSRFVFGDVMECLFVVLEAAVEEDLPPSLPGLLTVAYHILTIHPVEDYTEVASTRLLRLLQSCGERGLTANILCAAVAAFRHAGGSLKEFCKMVRIDKCAEEALLCESCHLLIHAPEEDVDADHVLMAIEILLTRTDVEPNILSKALQRLESLVNSNIDLDVKRMDHVLSLVEKLKTSKDMSGNEARILHRDVVIFMGKYGNNNHISDESNNTMIAELKDKLTLNIPNPDEGTVYKLNLRSLLQLAITYEDPDALQKLLCVVCATLSSNKDPNLQLSLSLVVRALCRAYSHTSSVDAGCIQQAVLMCDSVACLTALMTYISEEKSPGVRKMLSDALEGLLLKDPGSEATEQLVKVAAEHAGVMMTSEDPTIKSGGLYITDTLLIALKDNHLLQRKELPHLITLILETEDVDSIDTFKTAYKLLLENFEIYQEEIIKEIVEKLIKNILKSNSNLMQDIERKIYKNKVKTTLEFFKEMKDFDYRKLLNFCKVIDLNFDLKVYLMAVCGWTANDNVVEEVLLKIRGMEWKCVGNIFLVEAVLKFLEVYGKEMLVKKKEITLQALGKVISNIPPDTILLLSKQLESCISIYTSLEVPNTFTYEFQNWYEKFNIQHLVESLNKDNIRNDDSKVLKALNIYLNLLKVPPYICDDDVSKLSDIVLDVYVENGEKYIEAYKEYLGVMLNISLRYKSLDDVREFILKSFEKVGMSFLKYFIEEFLDFLMRKPYILLEEDMKPVCVILNEMLKSFLKKKTTEDECIRMLELIDTIWPIYETKATFESKYTLLVHTTRLPLQLDSDSAPMRWAAVLVAEGQREEGVKLIGVLPGGELCSSAYRAFAAHFPARLSELRGVDHAALAALLDAAADGTALEIIMKLADCDPSKGWWDEAMASCMAAIARRPDVCKTVRASQGLGPMVDTREVSVMSIANILFEYPSAGVCKRLLIPLLRYSTSSFCEQFYSGIINRLFSTLLKWVRGSERDNQELRNVLKEHTKALALITLALEKIPLPSLKAQDSPLYREVEKKQPSYLMKRASSICVTLRKKPCPEGASDELKECYRQFQVELYKCLCAAVCVTKTAAKFYDLLFDAEVWGKMFPCDVTWELPLRTQWTQQKTLHTVADVSTSPTGRTSTASSTRTRMFLRTLSENPLQFDLMDIDEEPQENSHELELVLNELNSQDCADALTALFKHAASLAQADWLRKVAGILTGDAHCNVKWTTAQMICNSKEELLPHAGVLRPALFALVAETPRDVDGRKGLNNLHVDVLETILFWTSEDQPTHKHLNLTIEYLINSIIDNCQKDGVCNALVNLLGRLLDVYGNMVSVPWRCFEKFLTVPGKMKTLQRVLLAVTKHKINVPELLPALAELDERLWVGDIKLPELFGYALACGSEIERPLARYRHFLDRKRQNDVGEYVKMLYYAQNAYPGVCDEFHYKKILDLTSKLPGTLKSKCLHIISTFPSDSIENLDLLSLLIDVPLEAMKVLAGRSVRGAAGRSVIAVAASYGSHSDLKLRSQAVKVVLRAFEDLFASNQGEPQSKRSKPNSSKILSALESPDTYTNQVMEVVALGVTDTDAGISSEARERVAACLNRDDMKLRLAEAYLIAVCIPTTLTNKNRSLSVCASAFLELLFKRLMGNDRFTQTKLRDEPIDISDLSTLSTKLLTNTRTYQGTFLSSMGKRPQRKQGPIFSGINVQIPIHDILGALLSFAKNKPDVSQSISVEITRSILGVGRGFDPGLLARSTCDALAPPPGELTPLVVETARLLVGEICTVINFESCLDKLRQVTRCTEGESLVQLLHEETALRRDTDIFEMGTIFESDGAEMEVDYSSPSLEDIMLAFGKLSNWDKLTEQQKKEVNSGIPQLWVPEDTFRSWLDSYQVVNTKSWFNKLLSACRDECKQDSLRWLRETDRWPRKHFDISVVTEAIERQDWSERDVKASCDIRASDCLVEWAARLMLRRSFTGGSDSSCSDVASTRTHELSWCRAANERGLPRLALHCVDVNGSSPDITEAVSWQIEKARAMRRIGLDTNDVDMLGDALATLESSEVQLEGCSNRDVIAMNTLTLALHQDLGCLSDEKLRTIIESTNQHTKRHILSKKNKEMMSSLFGMAICYYDDVWPEDETEQNKLLRSMCDILGHVIDMDLPAQAEMLLSVVFNRMDGLGAVEEGTADNLLEKLSLLLKNLDATSLEQISSHAHLFPAHLLHKQESISALLSMSEGEEECRQQLSLVCDPRHALLRRCQMLLKCVSDSDAWSRTFELMRSSIFENPHAASSTEYTVLRKYKNELYQIEDYDSSDAKQKSTILNKISIELHKKSPARTSLRLSQLCPALAKYSNSGSERDECMSRLLRLGKLGVVKFYEQVSVFCDAVTRPAVLTALLSDGSSRRYIHKTGDRLRGDAAARGAAGAASMWGVRVISYSVTPLSEDSGMIEYVENTKRLRDMVNSEFDLDSVDIGARAEDEELILASSSLDQHRAYCRQVPPHALRSAIEANCISTEDFINKKQMFLETLSSITVLTWLFGLGDRHLENLLYCAADGALLAVDWAALFQYGARELPPARLTRNMVAVCDVDALEARLQTLVASLRRSHKLYLNVVKMSFKWMGEEFFDKFPYIEQYARGQATSREVTQRALQASNTRYKERLVKLVEDTFADLEDKEEYSVVEQVTCLLRQCTDPRILSVTRSGWEPWV